MHKQATAMFAVRDSVGSEYRALDIAISRGLVKTTCFTLFKGSARIYTEAMYTLDGCDNAIRHTLWGLAKVLAYMLGASDTVDDFRDGCSVLCERLNRVPTHSGSNGDLAAADIDRALLGFWDEFSRGSSGALKEADGCLDVCGAIDMLCEFSFSN